MIRDDVIISPLTANVGAELGMLKAEMLTSPVRAYCCSQCPCFVRPSEAKDMQYMILNQDVFEKIARVCAVFVGGVCS